MVFLAPPRLQDPHCHWTHRWHFLAGTKKPEQGREKLWESNETFLTRITGKWCTSTKGEWQMRKHFCLFLDNGKLTCSKLVVASRLIFCDPP